MFHGSIFLHHSLWLLLALVLSRSPETVEGLTDLPALFTRSVGLKSAWCVSACSFLFIVFSFIHPSIQHSSSQEYRSYQTTDNQEPVAPALFKAALCSSLHVSISFFIGHMWLMWRVKWDLAPSLSVVYTGQLYLSKLFNAAGLWNSLGQVSSDSPKDVTLRTFSSATQSILNIKVRNTRDGSCMTYPMYVIALSPLV